MVACFAGVSKEMATSVVRSNVPVHDYGLFNDYVSNPGVIACNNRAISE